MIQQKKHFYTPEEQPETNRLFGVGKEVEKKRKEIGREEEKIRTKVGREWERWIGWATPFQSYWV